MSEKKYEYRILVQRNLTNLEKMWAIRKAEGWELQNVETGTTLGEALIGIDRGNPVNVSVRRELPPEPTEGVLLKDVPVQ
jgi:hypothetical protein